MLRNIEQARPINGNASAVTDRRAMWDRCWKEHVHLKPPYYNSDVIREYGLYRYVDSDYEYRCFTVLRDNLLARYCQNMTVWEFGCGNGHNILNLPQAKGFDWSESAVSRLRLHGMDVGRFDMFNPWPMQIPGAALTVHSMEQLGKNFRPMLDFLIAAKPKVVIHIEPILELYDPDNLFDYLAIQYHRKRGYLEGYLTALTDAKVELLEVKRSEFGSIMHEAYSVIVWKP